MNFSNNYDAGYGGWDKTHRRAHTRSTLVALSVPTPETETTCHYFFAFARNFGFDDPDIEDFCSRGLVKVFEEDFRRP